MIEKIFIVVPQTIGIFLSCLMAYIIWFNCLSNVSMSVFGGLYKTPIITFFLVPIAFDHYHKYYKLAVWSDSIILQHVMIAEIVVIKRRLRIVVIQWKRHFGFGNRPGLTQSVYGVFGLVQIKVINKEQNMIKQKHNIMGCIQWKDIVSTSICMSSCQINLILHDGNSMGLQ